MADAIQLSQALGLDPQLTALLVARGITTEQQARAFLHPDKTQMLSAEGICNIGSAAERIKQALTLHEKILVFGDYDCDGICATAILTHFLRSQGGEVVYFIPKREQGYGLSEKTVEYVVEKHLPDLMITVDCGIASVYEVELAQDLGVDVIVTDHHELQEAIPDCIVVDPKLGDCEGLRDICGAAVAMKLVEAIADKTTADQYLDLAALATVADVVPLLGENRIITACGLALLQNSARKGLRALIKSADLESVKAEDIGFRIGPRINALGRMNEDTDVVELLLTDEDFVVREVVEKVNSANLARQTLTKQLVRQAYDKLVEFDLAANPVIVLWDDKWESGVLGLVASKLCHDFYRPVILLTDIGDCYRGSARSIPQVNIFECLQATEQKLLAFGGHKAAAGMSISKDNLAAFSAAINEYVRMHYGVGFTRPMGLDMMLSKQTATNEFYRQLSMLEPFGEGFPAPVFGVDSEQCRFSRIGDSHHIKCRLNNECDVVAFGQDYLLDALATGVRYTFRCQLSRRTFQNRDYLQLQVDEATLQDISAIHDTPVLFGDYLKTILYPPKEVGTRSSSLQKEVRSLSAPTGTLFVAYCAQSVQGLRSALQACGKENLLLRYCVGDVPPNPLNTLVVDPVDPAQWQYYSSVVFLDAPLSKGYLAYVGSKAPSPELVLLGVYAYQEQMAALHLDEIAIRRTLVAIARWQGRCRTLGDLCMQLQSEGLSIIDAYAHFYIAYELGLVKVGEHFALSVQSGDLALDRSRVYKVLRVMQTRNV